MDAFHDICLLIFRAVACVVIGLAVSLVLAVGGCAYMQAHFESDVKALRAANKRLRVAQAAHYEVGEYPSGQFERRLGVTWESSRDMATHAALTDAYRNEGRMWSTGLAVGGAFALVSGVALWALGRPIISQSPPDYRP